jgi:MFS family permease
MPANAYLLSGGAATRGVALAITVAALGYFVDIYDLILFSIVRVSSLRDIGVPPDQILSQGVLLLNMQMGGMLLGGILWGILGDKRGRVSVLFGSIFMYSAANIANGFVQTVPQYAAMRLIAGIGLAGELGAGITLVSEIAAGAYRGTHDDRRPSASSAPSSRRSSATRSIGGSHISSAVRWASRCWCCGLASSSPACSRA